MHERSVHSFNLCLVRIVAGLFAELFGFHLEESRGVCFLEKEQASNLNDAICNGSSIEDPSPSGIFRDESTSNRSDGWSKKWRQTVYCDSFPSLFGIKAVTKNSATDLDLLVSYFAVYYCHLQLTEHFLLNQTETEKQSSGPLIDRHRMQC